MCHQKVSSAIYGSFKNQFIIGVCENRAPAIAYIYAFGRCEERIEKTIYSFNRQAVSQLMFRPFQHGLVLEEQSSCNQRTNGLRNDLTQNEIARARSATQRRHKNRSVQDDPLHIL